MKNSIIKLRFIKYIFNHPYNAENRWKGLIKYLQWQLISRLSEYPIIYQYTDNSKLLLRRGLSGADGNFYCGLMEYDDMGFLLHFLRSEDLFIDIGANVGAYSVLASAEIMCNSISIEPIPNTYKHLMGNILINDIQDKVVALNIGMGSERGVLKFTKSLDAVNHVATDNEMDTINIEVDTLDSIISDKNPLLIKIDVEGFETEVLNGAHNTLENNNLKAIIIELNGSGMRYGYNEDEIHQKLINYGFKPFSYNPKFRILKEASTYGSHNTIYIRDEEFVKNRIDNARKVKIGSRQHVI